MNKSGQTNTAKLQDSFSKSLFTDLELTITNENRNNNNNITIKVHKNILHTSCPFFEKLLTSFKEKDQSKITIVVPNASVTCDIIKSFYGFKKDSTVLDWQYELEYIKCCDYLGVDYDLDYIKDLVVPVNGLPLLFRIGEITYYPDIIIDLLVKNIPENYNLSKVDQDLFTKIVKSKNDTETKMKNIEKFKNSRIVSTGYDDQIKIWNAETFELVKEIEARGQNRDVIVAPDGKTMITTNYECISKLYDTVTGQLVMKLIDHDRWTNVPNYVAPRMYGAGVTITYSPDSQKIISAYEGEIKIWDIAGTLINTIGVKQDGCYISEFCITDEKIIYIGRNQNDNDENEDDDDNEKEYEPRSTTCVTVLDFKTGDLLKTFVKDGSPEIIYENGEKVLYLNDEKINIWNLSTGELVKIFDVSETMYHMTISSDGKKLVAWIDEKDVSIWDLDTGNLIKTIQLHVEPTCFAFTPDGKHLVAGCDNGTIEIWNIETYQLAKILQGNTRFVSAVMVTCQGMNMENIG